MGNPLSTIKKTFKEVKTLIIVLRDLNTTYQDLLRRTSAPPGLPVANSTTSFWQRAPPHPELVDIRSPSLPARADILIIGSGITAAAVARSLLRDHYHARRPRIVVAEARQVCSGATGRNGGHIKASPHELFGRLVERHGLKPDRAAGLVRFQLSHLDYLVSLCRAEVIDAAECREVETVDLYVDGEAYEEDVQQVEELRKWVPEFEMRCYGADEARERFSVNEQVAGAISYRAGALWPYRFVTAVWKKLLDEFPDRLSIETGTPVESIEVDEAAAAGTAASSGKEDVFPYKVTTSRGVIRARHVVHATNAFAPHLVPGLRMKMAGALAHMSAQRPGKQFPDLNGTRSWSFIFKKGSFDYVTQRPTSDDGVPGEIMLGGGFFQSEDQGADLIGVFDDSRLDTLTQAHLEGIMPTLFSPKWGEDAEGGRVKDIWSGIISVTADSVPFVGKLDDRLTGRRVNVRKLPLSGHSNGGRIDADVGEWISAGYVGDGMVWAWLCGSALGTMIMGAQKLPLDPAPGRPAGKLEDWFPSELYATYERIRHIDIADLADDVM